MTPPDCWANGVAIRCFKCRKVLGNQNWFLCNVAPDAASGGTMMPFHRECAPVVFSGPTFGPSAAEVTALRKDAERYRWLKSERGFNEAGIFIARQDAAGIVRWNYEAADQLIDAEMRPLIEGKANER